MGHGRAKAESEARFEVVVWELDFAAGERFIAQERETGDGDSHKRHERGTTGDSQFKGTKGVQLATTSSKASSV